MSLNQPPADALPVEVNGRVLDPYQAYAKDAKNTDYIVVTVRHVLSVAEEEELNALHITILEDLGNNNFLCHYPDEDLHPIREKEYVRQVDVYRNKFKIPEALLSAFGGESARNDSVEEVGTFSTYSLSVPTSEEYTVNILTHETVNEADFEALKSSIADKIGITIEDMDVATNQIRITLGPEQLAEIAQDDRIRIIEQDLQPSLMGSSLADCRPIVRGEIEAASFPYTGKDQIITVTDTGFDTGSSVNCHPAFTGKVHSLISLARAKTPGLTEEQRTDDPDGHGTHVSGIILGKDFDTTKGFIGGIAPDAKLIMQSCYQKWNKRFELPLKTLDIFESAHKQKSRIFSNSWGVGFTSGRQPDYIKAAEDIDNYLRNTPEAFICFSAGNDNGLAPGQPTIGVQASCKNVLTVGATGSRSNPNEMYPDSSMGPTKQKRLKPDVVAPGQSIFSAVSRSVTKPYDNIATTTDLAPDIRWRSISGTSQATPLVAGCAAILREALQAQGCAAPFGVLLKALLINGADFIPGLSPHAQGHGRVNLRSSLSMLSAAPLHPNDPPASRSITGGTFVGSALSQDDEHEFVLRPATHSQPSPAPMHFKATLVYNDIGHTAIQNNLNLFVTDLASGVHSDPIPGNDKSLVDLDVQNNVEQVLLPYVPAAGVRIKVHAQKILARQVQDYVVAWGVFAPLVHGL
ncbi:hypothetical protein ACN47E_008329 [Coniothyrium glycines]